MEGAASVMYLRLLKNGAEGILEPFYDGGEAYRDYHKYMTLGNYETNPQNSAEQTWCEAKFKILPRSVTTAVRECDFNAGRFDEIYISGKIPADVNVCVYINGEKVIDERGKGNTAEYSGTIVSGDFKTIAFEFRNNGSGLEYALVSHIGLRDTKYISQADIYGENTASDWEGCFEENPKIELFTHFFADSGDALRRKMQSDFFKADYEKTKADCMGYMNTVPEKMISRTLDGGSRCLYIGASTLAFVGYIEKDLEMLKTAARYALSLAACETWYQEDKELAEGVTWNGRVFQAAFASYGISIFMEFGGSILTWHGRNYLYEALARKGIARLDADFNMMEYIYHMNQGLAFSPGYVYALITMTERFPRYKKRIDEIEADVDEMLRNCINPDGGMFEGLGYWGYTIESYCLTAYALAKYRGKSIFEYINGRLDKTSDFALIMSGEKNIFRTVGDTGRYGFGKHISSFMYHSTHNELWKKYYEMKAKQNPEGQVMGGWYLAGLIFGEAFEYDCSEKEEAERFVSFPDTGYTYLRRGREEFFAISGKSFSHCHPDKGSFTIDLDGKPILIDRGMCGYSDGEADIISASDAHNTAVPIKEGYLLCQNSQHGFGSVMKKCSYENGVLEWICDNNNVWDKSDVKRNVRTITSREPYVYEITDEFEFTKPQKAAFILNMYDDEHIKAEPVNWSPEEIRYEPYSCDYAKNKVMRLMLISEEKTELKLNTRVTVK